MKTKITFILLYILGLTISSSYGQDSTAIADFESTTQGILVPRMLDTERSAIVMPARGLLVYQINGVEGFYYNYGKPLTPDWRLLGEDEDSDPTNEIDTWGTLGGIPAGFSDNIDNVDDADNSPFNEIEKWSTLAGIPAGFSDDIDNVDDADNDPNNEIELPAGGSNGQYLSTNGAGISSWSDIILSTDLGIGTASPISELHIKGADSWNQLTVAPSNVGSGDTSSVFFSEDSHGNYGMSILYDGEDNNLKIFGKSINSIYGPHFVISRGGDTRVGVGATRFGYEFNVEGDSRVSEYSQMGSDAPKIKMKKYTMSTPLLQGETTNIPHNLDANKILAIEAIVTASNLEVPAGEDGIPDFQFNIYTNHDNIYCRTAAGNSLSILDKPVRVLITYEE